MEHIKLDLKKAQPFVTEQEMRSMEKTVLDAASVLHSGTGAGGTFTGWIDQPVAYDRDEFKRIKEAAARIRSDSEVFITIGIGGSYLGSRAVTEALKPNFYNEFASASGEPRIYFAGNNLSSLYLSDLLAVVKDKEISLNVISKSGTTTEPAVAFRVFKDLLEKKYGREGAAKRIYVTADRKNGALKAMADREGYEAFIIPENIGGRFSVQTAVGLLSIAAAGIDIDAFMEGNAAEREHLLSVPFAENEALLYAAYRNIFYRQGRSVEILSGYEPNLHYMIDWWKQLYGESEGKDKKGLFPAGADFTTELHSLGQFIQDGPRIMFETVLNIEKPAKDITITEDAEDLDGLNYLAGKTVDYVNKNACEGTMRAHTDGRVPNLRIDMPQLDAYHVGALMYFFEYACGISGYTSGVNPFDQPGVEFYKNDMFELLGKPGYTK